MIAVTGAGIISALGIGVNETLVSLCNGYSGVGELKYLSTIHRDIPCAEVQKSDAELIELLGLSRNDIIVRTSLLGIVAAKEALESAGYERFKNKRVAFINGTTVGGMEKSEQYYLDFISNDSRNGYIAAHECGACTEKISDVLAPFINGFSFVTTISTACSSATNTIILGANLIKAGIVDVAVVGGSECITKFHLNGFNTLMILDKEPCRPFDATRAGLNLGEGAGFIVLERSNDCESENIEPLCYLSGYGNACDAFHQTASSENGIGAMLSMKKAIEMSGLKPSDIDYINAHGTGTPNNDLSEGRAIMSLFGDRIPYVSSTKSMTGHTTSASGGIEAVISILALKNGFIPANINFKNKMPELSFTPVSEVINYPKLKHVLSNSFGFGGNDSTIILSK